MGNVQKLDSDESRKKMMKSVVRISEGLGNQLFQYAFAYSYAKRTGQDILIDPFFWGTSLRNYELYRFRIEYTRRFVSPAWDYLLGFGPRNARRYKERYRDRKIKKYYRFMPEKQIMKYDDGVYSVKEAAYFQGFWQSPLYFEEFYEQIREQFTLKEALGSKAQEYTRQMAESNSVSLHIRRTDYDRDENNVCLDGAFYREALEKMKEAIGEFKLFLFTDDKAFAKKYFDLHEYIMVEGVEDIEEFALMQKCKNHIVANSSFSWWGAYLAENKGGVVFAPVADIWGGDFYPREWNLIQSSVGSREGLSKENE